MHGVIFTSFRDYVTQTHGQDAVDAIFGDEFFLLSESYDDEQLASLIERAQAATGRDLGELVHAFGVFTAERTFTRLYPAFFAIAGSTRQFLLTIETRIHELVRATIPDARPPQLDVRELGADGVSIVYSSPRKLCVLLRGLTEGTARHYGEAAAIEEMTCMHRGDATCTFEVRLTAAAQSA